MSCHNCNDGHVSYAVTDKRQRCLLCGLDLAPIVAQRKTLIAATESKIEEIRDLLSAYQRLRTLGSPLRASLLVRAQGALQAMLSLESSILPEFPAGQEVEVTYDARDCDEGGEEDEAELI